MKSEVQGGGGWEESPATLHAAGGVLLLSAIRLGWGRNWVFLLLAAAICGHAVAAEGVRYYNATALPLPQPVRPLTMVKIDRTISTAPLSLGGFNNGDPEGFGIFERWILRLGYFFQRTGQQGAFDGDLLVIFRPSVTVPEDYLSALTEYVRQGGKVLVLDSPPNAGSTANSLLWPFGLSLENEPLAGGRVVSPDRPAIDVESAREVVGGRPIALLGEKPVAAAVSYGKGTIAVLGFGSRFTDANMGVTDEVVPDAALRNVFEFEFSLLRDLVENRTPVSQPAAQ